MVYPCAAGAGIVSVMDLKASFEASLSVSEGYRFEQGHHFGGAQQYGWGATMPVPWQEPDAYYQESEEPHTHSDSSATADDPYPPAGPHHTGRQSASHSVSYPGRSHTLAQAAQHDDSNAVQHRHPPEGGSQHPAAVAPSKAAARYSYSQGHEDGGAQVLIQMHDSSRLHSPEDDDQDRNSSLDEEDGCHSYTRSEHLPEAQQQPHQRHHHHHRQPQEYQQQPQQHQQQQQATYQQWKQQQPPLFPPDAAPRAPSQSSHPDTPHAPRSSEQQVGGSMFTQWAPPDTQERQSRTQLLKEQSQAQQQHQSRPDAGQAAAVVRGAQQQQQQQQQRPVSQQLGLPFPAAVPPRQAAAGGLVVRMKRSQAWARFLAYEGCVQVCVAQLSNPTSAACALQFLQDGCRELRLGFGVDQLLLAPAGPAGAAAACNDICWDDAEQADGGLRAVQCPVAVPSSASFLHIRPTRVTLPPQSVLARLCGHRGTHAGFHSDSPGLRVCCSYGEGQTSQHAFPIAVKGAAQPGPPAMELGAEQAHGSIQVSVLVHDTTIATGSLPCSQLWKLGSAAGPGEAAGPGAHTAGVSTVVEVQGVGRHAGKRGLVAFSIARVRRDVQVLELGLEAAAQGEAASQQHTVRVGGTLAYDCVLDAALLATRRCRAALSLEGSAWEWLMVEFAALYGITSFYICLAYLRWMLSPSVASPSPACLSAIEFHMRGLLASSAQGILTQHEAALLKKLSRDTEQLLEVAFELYFRLDDAHWKGYGRLGDNGNPTTYNPSALKVQTAVGWAAMKLFCTLKDIFAPADQDWMNARFRIAAHKRWHSRISNSDDGPPMIPNTAALLTAVRPSGGGRPLAHANSPLHGMRPPAAQYQPQRTRLQGAIPLVAGDADTYYRRLERLNSEICDDLKFDLWLKEVDHELLPSCLNLAGLTAEVYCERYAALLRDMLSRAPPTAPTVPAVDLLVAVAKLQMFLQETLLSLPRDHPGHLDAMELFRPHVLGWITGGQEALCGCCRRLEAEGGAVTHHGPAAFATTPTQGKAADKRASPVPPAGRGGGGNLGGLGAAQRAGRGDLAGDRQGPDPFRTEGHDGEVAPLVSAMIERANTELQLYERVVKYWPGFGPHLEGAMCRVVRAICVSLTRVCNGDGAAGAAGPTAGNPHPARRSPNVMHPGRRDSAASSHHSPSAPPAPPAASAAAAHPSASPHPTTSPPHPTNPYHPSAAPSPGPMGAYAADRPRPNAAHPHAARAAHAHGHRPLVVLVREATLLNSLKCLMGAVPMIEERICKWCGGSGSNIPTYTAHGSPVKGRREGNYEDLPPHIGVQFAQVVKELRSDYTTAVALCANRLADTMRAHPTTNLKVILSQPFPTADQTTHHATVSSATVQREYVESLMVPLRSAAEEAAAALRGALDPRVYVATLRALWDALGQDLYEFVNALQVNPGAGEYETLVQGDQGPQGAWRARQVAHSALGQLNTFFEQCLALPSHACSTDLILPAHVAMVEKLLAQSGQQANMNFNPF
ncbi:MAG: hypothetical protein WDW36_008792 [Sanguina aurantia]